MDQMILTLTLTLALTLTPTLTLTLTSAGIMDQMISACGRQSAALLIDCRPPFADPTLP